MRSRKFFGFLALACALMSGCAFAGEVRTPARIGVLASGRVDAVFWTRGVYGPDGAPLPFPLDRMEGVIASRPYCTDSRVSVSLR